jgi:hypothetical protein
MELHEQIAELAGRIEAGWNPYISYDEIQQLPPGRLEELMSMGILLETNPAKTIVCKKCDKECSIEPSIEPLPQTGEIVGLHLCKTKGLIKVAPECLRRWEIVAEKTTIATKPIAEPENKKLVEINLQDFSETKSKQLLRDLIACPSGVTYSINNHGKDQPKAIKKILKVKYLDIANDIHIEKGRIYLEKYVLKGKNNLPQNVP